MAADLSRFDLATWRERLAETFVPLDVEPLGSDSDFTARILDSSHGAVKAATVDVVAQPHTVRRPSSKTAQDSGTLLVSVQLTGTCLVRQDGREALLGPTDVAIYDSSRPYELHFPSGGHRQTVLQVPSDRLDPEVLNNRTAIRVPGNAGLGHALSPLLAAMPQAFPEVRMAEAERLIRSGLDLLGQCLRVSPETSGPGKLRHMAHEYLELHANDSTLGPEDIAAELHISVSHLHRVFQGSGKSVRRSLIEIRLRRAARDLRDNECGDRTIADIAYSHGFKDAAHFTRTFTEFYGVPPSVWRRNVDARY